MGYLDKGEGLGAELESWSVFVVRCAMPNPNRQRLSRLHSRRSEDAAWREQQADVDADIEGLSRDPEADRLMAEMDASGVPINDQIKHLKAYFVGRSRRKPAVV